MNARQQQRMALIENATLQRHQLQQMAQEWSQGSVMGVPHTVVDWIQLANLLLKPGAALPTGQWLGWLTALAAAWKWLERQEGAPVARWSELFGQIKNTVHQWRGQNGASPVKEAQPNQPAHR